MYKNKLIFDRIINIISIESSNNLNSLIFDRNINIVQYNIKIFIMFNKIDIINFRIRNIICIENDFIIKKLILSLIKKIKNGCRVLKVFIY